MSSQLTRGDDPNVLAALKAGLNDAMLKAAEPILQQAMMDIEIAMRKQLAANLIALIDSEVDLQRLGRNLVVTIRGDRA